MSTANANVKARQRAELHAYLHDDTNAGQSIPGCTVIDLTEDSETENPGGNLGVDSEIEFVD